MNAHDPTKVEVNLSNCDREPIHIPGAVQPHGALLAYGVDALRLCCWSSNVDDVLGGSLVGGESIDASFSAATVERLKHIVAGQPGIVHPLRVALKTFDGKRTIDAAAHVWQGVLIVELEIEAPSEGDQRRRAQPPVARQSGQPTNELGGGRSNALRRNRRRGPTD